MKTKYIFRTLLMAVGLLMGTMSAKAAVYDGAGTYYVTIPYGGFDDYSADAVLEITYGVQAGHENDASITYGKAGGVVIRKVDVTGSGTIQIPIAGYNNSDIYNVAANVSSTNAVIYKVEITSSSPAVTKYTLTYVSQGATVYTERLEEGARPTPPADPVRNDDWTFDGWDNLPTTMPAHDVTATAKFLGPLRHLYYKLYNEVTYSYDIEHASYEINAGNPTQVPENDPERDGYTFSGWEYIPSTMPNQDFTVQGRYIKNDMPQSPVWQESSVTYAVPVGASFYSGQAIEVKSESGNTVATLTYGVSGGVVFNTAVASSAIDAFEAYTPGNGTNGNESGGTFYTIKANYDGFIAVGVVLNKDKAFYIEEDGIAMNDYNGKVNATKYKGAYGFTVKAGSTYKIYASGSKLGFFGFKYDYSTTKYTLTYKVDGQTYHVDRLEEGVTPTLPADPTKVGYRFVGWTGVPNVMPTEAVTAEAEFTINTYKLTYKVDGVEVASYDYEYNATITPIEYTEVSGGYVFSGWNNLPTKMPAYDVEVEGRVLKEIQQVQITISSSTGYATFSYNEPMDFTNVTGLQAYIVKQVNETTATLEQVTGIIAAGTGLIVKGYTAVVPTSNTSLGVSPSGNLLVGVTGSSHTIQSATEFVLTEVSGEARFQATEGHAAVIPENHAYLSTPSSSRTLRIVMADKTTEIEDVPVAEKAPLIIYDLRGHRVPNPKKGTLYIVNGKQTVWK